MEFLPVVAFLGGIGCFLLALFRVMTVELFIHLYQKNHAKNKKQD